MKRNIRRRTVDDDDEDKEEDEAKAQEDHGQDSTHVMVQSLVAVRELQRMRGTKAYRDAQLEAKRRAQEHRGAADDKQGLGASQQQPTYGLTTRRGETPSTTKTQAAPVDITDHTKRMFAPTSNSPSGVFIVLQRATGKSTLRKSCASNERAMDRKTQQNKTKRRTQTANEAQNKDRRRARTAPRTS